MQCCSDSTLEDKELAKVDPGLRRMVQHIRDKDDEMLAGLQDSVHRGVSAIQAGGCKSLFAKTNPLVSRRAGNTSSRGQSPLYCTFMWAPRSIPLHAKPLSILLSAVNEHLNRFYRRHLPSLIYPHLQNWRGSECNPVGFRLFKQLLMVQ